MRKLLQINPVLRTNTSTGRIMQEIGELAMQNGWESHIAYSYGRDGILPCTPYPWATGGAWHGTASRPAWPTATDWHRQAPPEGSSGG